MGVQNPIRLERGLEPQPDIAVVRAHSYGEVLPGPQDLLFLIEVADASLAYDRDVKRPKYARAGVREVWIVNLTGAIVERYTRPVADGYRLTARAGRGEELRSEVLPGISLATDSVLR